MNGQPPLDGATPWRAARTLARAILRRTGPRGPRRIGPLALAGAALIGGGAVAAYGAVSAGDVAPAERARIEAVVRDYILAHPEIIPQAIEKLRGRQMTQSIDENRAAIETPYRGSWEGAAQPAVTLVEFFDYACGYCRRALPDLARLLKEDPGLRVVYRELPIIAEGSADAAKASLYAAEQGKYPAFHAAMYAQGGVERANILAAARAAGLDRAGVEAALASDSRNGEIANNIRLAQALKAEGTPVFVVGDKVLYGAVGYDALKEAVEAARKGG